MPWGVADLAVFGSFFALTLWFLPTVFVFIAGKFISGVSVSNLSGEAQILIQSVLDILWVGFIFFLIKVIHRQRILESIHWIRTQHFRKSNLIAIGAALALAVLIVSSFFPPKSAPPIAKLVESTGSLYVLVAFGVLFAPLAEEVMFRGFFFTVLDELGGPRVAVPCTALLFAFVHAPQLWGSWAGIVLIFVVGYILSVIRQRSNSLIPSLIVHTAYNSMLFCMSVLLGLLQRGK